MQRNRFYLNYVEFKVFYVLTLLVSLVCFILTMWNLKAAAGAMPGNWSQFYLNYVEFKGSQGTWSQGTWSQFYLNYVEFKVLCHLGGLRVYLVLS